jgi:hypothetical protein
MTIRPYSVLVAGVAVLLFAAVGYRVGQSARATAEDAASAWGSAAAVTFSHARSSAYHTAWLYASRQGLSTGAAAARSAAVPAGYAAGAALATSRATASRALAVALASAPTNQPPNMKTERCLPIAGGLCEVLGPAVTGKRCPRSSVADVEGGVVCIPRVLLRVAQTTAPPLQLAP